MSLVGIQSFSHMQLLVLALRGTLRTCNQLVRVTFCIPSLQPRVPSGTSDSIDQTTLRNEERRQEKDNKRADTGPKGALALNPHFGRATLRMFLLRPPSPERTG